LRQPDITVWFALDPAIAAKRLSAARVPDRFESQPLAFFQSVHNGYAARAAAESHRFAKLDASASIEQVRLDLLAQLRQRQVLP
jgi:dTMP kinase